MSSTKVSFSLINPWYVVSSTRSVVPPDDTQHAVTRTMEGKEQAVMEVGEKQNKSIMVDYDLPRISTRKRTVVVAMLRLIGAALHKTIRGHQQEYGRQ